MVVLLSDYLVRQLHWINLMKSIQMILEATLFIVYNFILDIALFLCLADLPYPRVINYISKLNQVLLYPRGVCCGEWIMIFCQLANRTDTVSDLTIRVLLLKMCMSHVLLGLMCIPRCIALFTCLSWQLFKKTKRHDYFIEYVLQVLGDMRYDFCIS